MNSLPKIVVSPPISSLAVLPRPSDAVSQPLTAHASPRARLGKPIMRRIAQTCLAAFIGLPLAFSLAGCGQKGALYLPAPADAPAGASAQPASPAPQQR
jgi:predicted small lipoprotein YifL